MADLHMKNALEATVGAKGPTIVLNTATLDLEIKGNYSSSFLSSTGCLIKM